MKHNLGPLLVLLLTNVNISYSQVIKEKKDNKIVIEGQVPLKYKKDVIKLTTFPLKMIEYHSKETKEREETISDNYVKWSFYSDEPLGMFSPFTDNAATINFCLEPGDSISIRYDKEHLVFSGNGAAKFDMIYRLRKIEDSLKTTITYRKLSRIHTPLYSLNDYFLWNSYLNKTIEIKLTVIDRYKDRISDLVYNATKEGVLSDIEKARLNRFLFLTDVDTLKGVGDSLISQFGLKNSDLCAIYDSTVINSASRWLQAEPSFVGDPQYLYSLVRLQSYRNRGKFFKNSALDTPILACSKENDYMIRYSLAKNMLSGIVREEVLSYFFHSPVGALHNIGFEPQIEAMLMDYYKQPGYAEYKAVVREYELRRRRLLAERNNLDFSLTDIDGKIFTKNQLRGKIALIRFWYTGCEQCVQLTPLVSKIEKRFKKDTNVVFLNVSTDAHKEKWVNSLNGKEYVNADEINLYTGGYGENHPIIKNFGINGFPSLILFDALGDPVYPDFDVNNKAYDELVALIERRLVLMKDGPYITYNKNKIIYSSINGTSVIREITNGEKLKFKVQADKLYNTFTVSLKNSMTTEPSKFPMPKKLIALSDIEGNLDALATLLIVNKIIDNQYNWTFGDGHLVFVGDMFDRGNQVTECLWLLYKLEDEAKEKGGYVHFVLGNHEIMNLQGKIKYVQEKYKFNASLINDSIAGLFSIRSELGRWLRTKNIVERIGDLLFVHAGISNEINKSSFSLGDINGLARRYYDKRLLKSDSNHVQVVMGPEGPFWYRGYYKKKLKGEYIDSTLRKFSVNRIVTGHTILDENITIHHDGKVINVDTDHKRGKSEALLIENNIFYRVNIKGEKRVLFDNIYQSELSYN